MVNIRKRGKVYQYQFEIAKVEGKRKYISKSGFKTKNEALMAEMKACDEYINGGVTNDTFICAFLMACYTGMRTGEVFALTWDDIDLKNRIIKINKTVYCKKKDNKGRWFLGATKTTGSYREVLI